MTRPSELTGQRFGMLLVLNRAENSKCGQTRWNCRCDCGGTTVSSGTSLKSQKTKTCGCIRRKKIIEATRTHGMTGTREYNSWRGMKARCDDVENSHYELYGGRGISYPERWIEFVNFYEDMGNCPLDFQLDRIDVNKDYSKENCRWVDLSLQAFNTRKRKSNSTGKTGVSQRTNGKYYVTIGVRNKSIFLGVFLTLEEAIEKRKAAELLYYGFEKE